MATQVETQFVPATMSTNAFHDTRRFREEVNFVEEKRNLFFLSCHFCLIFFLTE